MEFVFSLCQGGFLPGSLVSYQSQAIAMTGHSKWVVVCGGLETWTGIDSSLPVALYTNTRVERPLTRHKVMLSKRFPCVHSV